MILHRHHHGSHDAVRHIGWPGHKKEIAPRHSWLRHSLLPQSTLFRSLRSGLADAFIAAFLPSRFCARVSDVEFARSPENKSNDV